jgi:hypothetical protein
LLTILFCSLFYGWRNLVFIVFYGFPYLCRRSSKAEKSPGKRRHSLAAKLNFLNLWRLPAKSSELFPVIKSSQRSLDGLHFSAGQLTGWLFLAYDKQAELYQPWKTNGWTFSAVRRQQAKHSKLMFISISKQPVKHYQPRKL